jgi:iron complex outermembrane receptor protein
MKFGKKSHRALRWSPLALAISMVCAPSVSLAQDDAKTMERVEVTGSRIKKTEIEGQSPVLTIEREELEKTGLTSIGDILQELTTGGKALNSKFNSSGNFGFPPDGGGIGAGSAQVDLRHLESKRVLVLVDGKRWVNESSASGVSGSVDLNTIPLAIVERIEVLEDGASAIYGSDAISGVINVITRREFDGAEILASYGEYDEGDGETTRAEITLGGGNDRFNAVFSASYNEQKRISSADRDLATEPVPGTGVTRGSSGTPQGRFIFCDPRVADCSNPDNFISITLNNGTGTPVYDPNNPTGGSSTYHRFTTADRFNFAPFNLVLTPSERKSIFASTRYEITDNTTWYTKALYNTRDSVNQAAPEPIFIGGDAGTGGIADTISISRLNPFNPFGIDLIAGQNFSLLGRRPVEAGPRIFEQTVDTWYFGTGLEGTFSWGERQFSWDVNYLKTENDAEQQFFNGFNLRRMQIALGDPAICAANPGCTPFNLFGGQGANGQGTITQEMLDFVRITTKDSSEQSLEVFSANLTGDIFDLPAGPLAFATGYEHRDYEGTFSPDQVRLIGESQDSRAEFTSGQYDVDELYAEFNVPLLSGVTGAKALDLSLALRYSDYSTFGSESTGKFGVRWQPTDNFILRGTYAEGFRAPFIGELFGLTQFGPTLNDPCSGYATSGNATLIANCQALGIPASYEQINPQITTNTGGNEFLQPETADSYTLGAVYSAGWAEDTSWSSKLDFELTYYNHEIDDAVQAPDAQTLLDRCVATVNTAPGCTVGGEAAIQRTPGGQIVRFDNLLANIGSIETDGFDFKIDWASPDWNFGRFGATFQSTYVADYEATDAFGNTQPRTVGVEVNDSAIPEWQANLSVDWVYGDWNVNWTARYIDRVTESCSDFLDGTPNSFTALGLCSNPNTADNSLSTNDLGSTTYHDVQVNWATPLGVEGLRLTLGINNLFDKDPPTCLTCSLNGYDAGTHDLPGQFWYVQAVYKFQ